MSTLDIDAIRNYLIEVNGKIEYPILVNAFKKLLYNPDPNLQGLIRTQFKDYVNKLATVSLENNMKFIILRPEFRPENNIKQQQVLAPQINHQPAPSNNLIGSSQRPIQAGTNFGQKSSPPRLQQQPQLNNVYNSVQNQNIPILPPRLSQQQQQQQKQIPINPAQPPPVPQHQPNPATWNDRQHDKPITQGSDQRSPSLQQQNSLFTLQQNNSNQFLSNEVNGSAGKDIQDSVMMPPPPSPLKVSKSSPLSPTNNVASNNQLKSQLFFQQRPESLNLSAQMPPPRPPPRRRQSTASLFKPSPKPIEKNSREIHDLAKKSPGRVREHALKLNSSTSSVDLNALMPMVMRSSTMKENFGFGNYQNRLSRDNSTISMSSHLARNNLQLTSRSRSSHREELESDSSSLQPIDPLKRKWAIEACQCNYNGLMTLLRADPKLAQYKDIVNGYTALHWAAKFGNLDIIKLIAGTHQVSVNIKSSAGYTPLHVAAMFNRVEAAELLLKSYKANPDIRDHSGKRPKQYWPKNIR